MWSSPTAAEHSPRSATHSPLSWCETRSECCSTFRGPGPGSDRGRSKLSHTHPCARGPESRRLATSLPRHPSPLFAALDQLGQAPIPAGMETATQPTLYWPKLRPRLRQLASVTEVSIDWLRAAASILEIAEAHLDRAPQHLVHGDIHSSNLCLTGREAVIIDWGRARAGPALWDATALCVDMLINGQQPPPLPGRAQPGAHAANYAGGTASLLLSPERPWVTDPDRAKSIVRATTRSALRWAQQQCQLPK